MTSTATVKTPKEGGYGGEYNEPVTIAGVCFDRTASLMVTDYQLQAPVKGVLFIDPHVSKGAFEIPAGSLVSVDGEVSDATVHECEPVYGWGGLHHWECVLV
jgi:hypothetical protein